VLLLCAVRADCGLKNFVFALVLTVLTSQKCRRRQIVKGLRRRRRRFYALREINRRPLQFGKAAYSVHRR